MEHILHSQVMKHLEAHAILSDLQHGFRKRRFCESQLILTLQDLAAGMDEGQQIDVILLDFSNAFDKVPHEVVSVTKRRNPIGATYQIHGHDLAITKTGKYLGVIISEDLSWKPHVDATTKRRQITV